MLSQAKFTKRQLRKIKLESAAPSRRHDLFDNARLSQQLLRLKGRRRKFPHSQIGKQHANRGILSLSARRKCSLSFLWDLLPKALEENGFTALSALLQLFCEKKFVGLISKSGTARRRT